MQETINGQKQRILSIDAFRGLTILVMIFVNDLAGLRGVPDWLKHMPANIDGMTFVDVVFPAFLFIVGISIPFAMEKRLAISAGISEWHLWGHILMRFIGLLAIGVFMVNQEHLAGSGLAIPASLWVLLLYICVILVWNLYPRTGGIRRYLFISLRLAGVLGLVALFLVFRGEGGRPFVTSWWGILGLIGWAYLPACILYRLMRRTLLGIGSMTMLFILFAVADRFWTAHYSTVAESWRWGLMIGAHGSIVLAGVFTGMIMAGVDAPAEPRRKLLLLFGAALFFWLAGRFLHPLFGTSKLLGTPSWCLYSTAYSILIFAALFWLIDIRRLNRWGAFLKPAGENPLLAYILPEILAALIPLLGITLLDQPLLSSGFSGILRSLLLSLLLVWLTGRLGRLGLRLKF